MKFKQVKTIKHLLKEYGASSSGSPTPVGQQGMGSMAKQVGKSLSKKVGATAGAARDMAKDMVKGQDSKTTQRFKSIMNRGISPTMAKKTVSPTVGGVASANIQDPVIKTQAGQVEKGAQIYDQYGNYAGKIDSPLGDDSAGGADAIAILNKQNEYEIKDPKDEVFVANPKANEGKLSKIAKRKGKKIKIKNLKNKIKKLSRKGLSESEQDLFEINFNQRSVEEEALNAKIKCGFEAETFFYNVDKYSQSDDVDNMSISDIEYEFGDLPDSAYSDFNDWVMDKAMDEYLETFIDEFIEEEYDNDEFRSDFAYSVLGDRAVEDYKEEFEDNDPNEFQNREEDGWDDENWRNDLIDEEYADDYRDFLRDIAEDDEDVRQRAVDEAESDYTMDDWVADQYSYMSSFLDDYGFEYSREGDSQEQAAMILSNWVENNSAFTDYPEYGEYGYTDTTVGYSVENDASLEDSEYAGIEIISPVFDRPSKMLKEMKSLFEWGEDNFYTNRQTGLHVTMSYNGKNDVEANKLKMAVLLGDQYLLKQFSRLGNTYTKSQYANLVSAAEKMQQGDVRSFKQVEDLLRDAISGDKFNSINFKGDTDYETDNQLIEFRIGGGSDYEQQFDTIQKAVVRYATIMIAGHEEDAYRKDYINAISRLIRRSTEVDPKKVADLNTIEHPVIDAGKMIAGKRDYFEIIEVLNDSLEAFAQYKELLKPEADKEWRQEIKDYEKGTGEKISPDMRTEIEEEIRGYIRPSLDSPKVRAIRQLANAREKFMNAVVMLAKDVAFGIARSKPTAKMIGAFRKYAFELGLKEQDIDNLAKDSMNKGNFPEYDPKGNSLGDEERIVNLKKGIDALFRKKIVSTPDFLSPQLAEKLIDGLWQFFQSDDKKDGKYLEKLSELLDNMQYKISRRDIRQGISTLANSRQKNDFVRKVKGGGYDMDGALINPYSMTDLKAVKELEKFLSNYKGYMHPTGRDHHVNIRSDDDYYQVAQYSLVQKLRTRIDHLRVMERREPEKADALKRSLVKIGKLWIQSITYENENPGEVTSEEEQFARGESKYLIGLNKDYTDTLLNRLDEIVERESVYNFTPTYNDSIIDNISILSTYYAHKKNYPDKFKDPNVKKIVADRMAATTKFLTMFDKLFQEQGFADLKPEISAKSKYDKLNNDFVKNVRNNAIATLNIPSHSRVFIQKDFIRSILNADDPKDEAMRRREYFDSYVNRESNGVFVIPAAHWTQVSDAENGLELISKMEAVNNYFHSWRKTGYQKLLHKFKMTYGRSLQSFEDQDNYSLGGGELYSELKKLGIAVTHIGDSRTGAPEQKSLIDPEELKNPISGEPIDKGSGMMWSQTTADAEQKRFDAFDFSVYPEKVKELVADKIDKGESLGSALDDILTQINKGKLDINPQDLGKPEDRLIRAAGVEGMEDRSSSEVADNTNWSNLADYLKIERGVNDQGVNLLKKVYDQYDSDHNWRPEDPRAIGTERWAAAVRAAYDYIKKNYKVSGGNYFRDGDDVSSLYGGGVTEQDYDDMRRKYFNFNQMMMNGIQFYIMKPDVNRLVDFLKNPDNDEAFKKAVLQSMMREREAGAEPNDFQGHLARGRQYLQSISVESVFKKFDKLPLVEQLRIVSESDVLEKWSKKYKASINCSNPKGFSQKAHCAGKKKKKESLGDLAYANKLKQQRSNITPEELEKRTFEKFARIHGEQKARSMIFAMKQRDPQYFINKVKQSVTESVPNNTKVRMINKLLSDEFPASDLRKQMDAFFAIPDPQILKDFRQRRAEAGDDACLRPILRNYIQMKLHPKLHKYINLNESKEDLIAKLDALPDDESTNKLINYIEQLIDDMGVGGKIKSLSSQLEVIPDVDVKKAINQIAKIVASIEMSPKERAQLFVDWKADKLVNVDALLSTSTVKMSDIYKGYGEKGESHITELVDDLNQVVQYGIGPGEFALSVLSQRIEGIGAASGEDEGKGDLIIDGSPVELKTTRKNAARFNDREVTVSDSYKSLVTAFFNKYKSKFEELEQQGLQVRVKSGMQQNHVMEFLKAVPEAEKEVAEIISNIFTNLNVSGGPIARYLAQGDKNGAMQLIAQSNVNNYLEKKRQSGNLLGILFIDLKKQTFNFIKDISDLEGSGLRLHAKTNYLITTNENPFANTSIVDSGA